MRFGFKQAVFICLFSFAFFLSFGQVQQSDASFQHLTSDGGLSHQVIHSMLQDSEGFLWFGTEDGLNRYDGYNFTIFRNNPNDPASINDNFIYSIFEDSKGDIWVGTNNGGISRYNKSTQRFTNYENDEFDKQSISSNRIAGFAEDKDGTIWIATFFGGLSRYNSDTDNFTNFVRDESSSNTLPSNDISAILIDDEGYIWLGTQAGISRYSPADKTFYNYFAGDKYSNNITALFIDQEGDLWAGTTSNLLKRNKQSNQFDDYIFLEEEYNGSVRVITQTPDGLYWFGTERDGFFQYDKNNNQVVQFRNDELSAGSLMGNEINSIVYDFSGNLWVAIHGSGIDKLNLNKKKFVTFRKEAGKANTLSNNTIRSLLKSANGTIWAGTTHYGLNKINPETKEILNLGPESDTPNGMTFNSANCLLEDSKGQIWVGTWGGGIDVFEDPTNDLTRVRNYAFDFEDSTSLRSDQVQDLFEDNFGNIWVGTESGLDILNPNTGEFRHFNHDPKNLNSMTQYGVQSGTIIQDRFGNIWVSTWDGLNKLIPDFYTDNTFDTNYQIVRYQKKEGTGNSVSDNRIICVYYNEDVYPDHIFVGTYGGGINVIEISNENHNNIKVEVYTTGDGLPNNVVYCIFGDEDGNLWLSTNKGLSKFNPLAKTFKNYDTNDGLQGNQFFWGSGFQSSDGELLFGGTNGFNTFYPNEIVNDATLPKVYITSFKLNNKEVPIGQEYSGKVVLEKSVERTKEISLTYKENFFTFGFTSIHYAYPNSNSYQYMMEGFDSDWITASSAQRFATYTNLNPGDYTFKVKGSNYDGVWVKEPVEMNLVIKPPFYRTYWFYTITAIFVIAIVVIFIKIREKQLKKDKQQLEEAIDTKTRELEKTKQEILAKNEADKVRNWMAASMSEVSQIISKDKDDVFNLSSNVLNYIVKALDAQQGAVMIINEEDPENKYLELLATYAYEEEKLEQGRIDVDNGLVGNSYTTGDTIYITDLPEGYTSIHTGLGEASPSHLLLVPFKLEDVTLGVIELTFFHALEEHQVQFVEQVGEAVASSIYILRMSDHTQKLLEQSRQQSEELMAQEEELRQNMEELEATTESFHRREQELVLELEELRNKSDQGNGKKKK